MYFNTNIVNISANNCIFIDENSTSPGNRSEKHNGIQKFCAQLLPSKKVGTALRQPKIYAKILFDI